MEPRSVSPPLRADRVQVTTPDGKKDTYQCENETAALWLYNKLVSDRALTVRLLDASGAHYKVEIEFAAKLVCETADAISYKDDTAIPAFRQVAKQKGKK